MEPGLELVRSLVLAHGWNTTCYQVINPGIAHWIASRGDALVGYVPAGRFRVVAGAPVCGESRLPEVVAEFERDAADGGRAVCYFGAEERLEAVCREDPHHAAFRLGAQPVWHPSRLAESIGQHASLRAQVHRARNKGVTVAAWPSSRATRHPALAASLAAWLETRGLPPLHFLVEPDTLARLEDRMVLVAERGESVVGFLVLSPIPGRGGWLVEQIIRIPGAPNGLAELLVFEAACRIEALGARFVTMGLAPLSTRAGPLGAETPLWLRGVLTWVRAHANRFYNFKGLDAFKAKFEPDDWTPVHAIVNQATITPRVLYAIAHAFSGGSPIATLVRALGRAISKEVSGEREQQR